MKHEIQHRWTREILFSAEAKSVKIAVALAVKNNSNLCDSDLRGSNLPAPSMVLLAAWGVLRGQLTADLMLFDSTGHPDSTAFAKWATGGPCPYSGVQVERLAHFKEDKTHWSNGVVDTIYNLMVRVLREKCNTNL